MVPRCPPSPTPPPYGPTSASAACARTQSCSISSSARAWTPPSSSSSARISGSTAPVGACCPQRSKAWSRTRTSGESRSLAIHAGTPRGSAGRASLGPTGERPEARSDGLAASGTGSWGDGRLFCETGGDSDGPPRLACGSRLGAWSDGAAVHRRTARRAARGPGAALDADTTPAGRVVMEACPQAFQVT